MRQRKNADREMQPKTFPSRPKRKRLFLLFPSLFLFTSLKINMSEVASGEVPAENPFSLSREESIAPDTPPRGEGNQETLAVKAKENEKVTISKKGLAQLLQMLGSTFELPANEITPSVPPLAPESKESDTQEKKAAPEGENEPSIAELADALGAITAKIAQRQKGNAKRTPVQETPSFPMAVSPEQLEQPDLSHSCSTSSAAMRPFSFSSLMHTLPKIFFF